MAPLTEFSSTYATRILLIEHDADARARYAEALRGAGFSVLSIDEPPGQGPGRGGPLRLVIVPTAQYPAVRRTYPRVPFIVTADDVRDGVSACLRGADDWVPRGCSTDYFLSIVTAALRGRSFAL